jgi:nucleoside-diphosphate-sugar epimerase
MNITIIGGSGFVGTHLIDLLKQSSRDQLINIDKVQSEKYSVITKIGNVLDKQLLISQLQDTDIVILLAAEHRDDVTPVSLYYDVNVEGMKNVLEAMEVNNVKRIVFTSSVAIYGLDKNNRMNLFRLSHLTIMEKVNGKLRRYYRNGMKNTGLEY